MPVKRAVYAGSKKEQGYFGSAWSTVTSSDNRTMVTALGMFAAGVVFFNSSWSDIMMPL
ncbi:putative TOM core complex subunit Tom6 [Phyllosticta citriasiana]|uniref:TOM core complex subunit Tom6 n=1 Tax=Phyllosticta citriasiana TaxID=595635 RepID=A0ABR1L2Y6_9PEZI